MDQNSVVKEQNSLSKRQIDAGNRFLREFDKFAPVVVAFWARESDGDFDERLAPAIELQGMGLVGDGRRFHSSLFANPLHAAVQPAVVAVAGEIGDCRFPGL